MIKNFKNKLAKDKHFSELLKGSSVAFILRILGMILGYIFALMLAHQYGAKGVGIFSLVTTYIAIALIFAKAGLDISSMKYISRFYVANDTSSVKGLYLKSLRLILFSSIFTTILFWYFSGISAIYIFKKDYLSDIFSFATVMIVPMALLQFHAEIIRGYKKIIHYFLVNSISVSLIGIILLSLNLKSIFSDYVYIDIYIIAQFITLLLAMVIWLYDSKIIHQKVKNTITTKKLLKSSFPVMITGSIALVMGWMDIIMLSMYGTAADVGIYSMALKLATIISIALSAINSILAPKISHLYSISDFKNLEKIIHQATKMIFLIAFPILVICIIIPSYIMGMFGEDFKVGAVALIILSLGQFVNAISGSVGYILNMTDKENALRNITLVTAFLNIILNYIMIPKYGMNGAAIATAISIAFWNLYCAVYIYKKMNIITIYIPYLKKFINHEK